MLTASELWSSRQTTPQDATMLQKLPSMGHKWGDCSSPPKPHLQKQLKGEVSLAAKGGETDKNYGEDRQL